MKDRDGWVEERNSLCRFGPQRSLRARSRQRLEDMPHPVSMPRCISLGRCQHARDWFLHRRVGSHDGQHVA